MAYYVFQAHNGYWYWHLSDANNRKIAATAEGYQTKADCLHAIVLVKGSAACPVYG